MRDKNGTKRRNIFFLSTQAIKQWKMLCMPYLCIQKDDRREKYMIGRKLFRMGFFCNDGQNEWCLR